ncbi:MAG: right-handed parallel beta-helix repeat-containing protein [Candidatus Nanopelagicales bacterium]
MSGAQLPVSYNMSSLHGTLRYVAPNGSDSATGTIGQPYATIKKAESVSAAGDTVVVRGGTYSLSAQGTATIDTNNLTVIAYPGETPVFDGSIAAPTNTTTEGSLRSFAYQPMPAALGEGLSLVNLPKATFSGATPTGLAAKLGWACVSGNSYTDATPGVANGCGNGGTAYVITGYYPDQVWVNGQKLTQVQDKSRVANGSFYVERSAATDASPGPSRLYLSATDSADMSKVRVSNSKGYFLVINKSDGVRIEGLRIQDHSPAMNAYAILVNTGVTNLTLQDVDLHSVASVALKLAGGSTAGGSSLIKNATLNRVTAVDSGWSGAAILYTDDTTIKDSVFSRSSTDDEFESSPQKGGVKVTKSDRMRVLNTQFSDNGGPGIWFDQSNYDVDIANSHFSGNTDSPIFFEISHKLVLVNNTIIHDGKQAALRYAGSSGLKMVNNTIVGGNDVVAVLTDARSKTYGSDNRACAEHTVRYGQGGSLADCNVGYSSDFDLARPGKYGSTNLTPSMNWMPEIDMMVNNVLANPTGSSNCGPPSALCVVSYLSWSGINVSNDPATIINSHTLLDGNVYQLPQPTGRAAMVRTASGVAGAFTATTLADLKGPSGFGSSTYGKAVETSGQYATGGLVNADGTPTSALTNKNSQAAAVPTDADVNQYLSAGTKRYGASQ